MTYKNEIRDLNATNSDNLQKLDQLTQSVKSLNAQLEQQR